MRIEPMGVLVDLLKEQGREDLIEGGFEVDNELLQKCLDESESVYPQKDRDTQVALAIWNAFSMRRVDHDVLQRAVARVDAVVEPRVDNSEVLNAVAGIQRAMKNAPAPQVDLSELSGKLDAIAGVLVEIRDGEVPAIHLATTEKPDLSSVESELRHIRGVLGEIRDKEIPPQVVNSKGDVIYQDSPFAKDAVGLLSKLDSRIAGEGAKSRELMDKVAMRTVDAATEVRRVGEAIATIPKPKETSKLEWAWRIAILILLLLFAVRGNAQVSPQGVVLRGSQDSSVLFTRAGGLVELKCTTGMSCSYASNTFTITATAPTGGAVGGASSLTTQGYLTMVSATPGVLTPSPVYSDGTNVGVGTASPGAKFTVDGTMQIKTGWFQSDRDTYLAYISGNAYILPNAANANVFIATADIDGTPAIGRLTVKGGTNDGSTYVLMARNSDEGNVASLDTLGRWTMRGGTVYDERSTVGSSLFTIKAGEGQSTNSLLDIWLNTAGTTPGLHAKGDGNVGVGTATPGHKLDVQTSGVAVIASFIGASGGNSQIYVGSAESNDSALVLGHNSSGYSYIVEYGGTPGEALNIRRGGNVGINTTDLDGTPPIGRLTIKAACNDTSCNSIVLRDSDEANILTVDGNGLIQPLGGYKSADGTAGATVTTCTSFKNGLCVAGT